MFQKINRVQTENKLKNKQQFLKNLIFHVLRPKRVKVAQPALYSRVCIYTLPTFRRQQATSAAKKKRRRQCPCIKLRQRPKAFVHFSAPSSLTFPTYSPCFSD